MSLVPWDSSENKMNSKGVTADEAEIVNNHINSICVPFDGTNWTACSGDDEDWAHAFVYWYNLLILPKVDSEIDVV